VAALVVHLMSPGAASVQSDWDAPDGSVRHRVVSWRSIPPAISKADLIVAHGLAALVVSQTLANVGPGLVYRPTGATRSRRRPWSRRLRASWVAAPASRPGLAAAAALGLTRDRVVVVGDDDFDGWNRLALSMIRYEQIDADLLPSKSTRRAAKARGRRRVGRVGPGETVVETVAHAEGVVDAHVVDLPVAPEPTVVEVPPVIEVPRAPVVEPVAEVPVIAEPVAEVPVVAEPLVAEPVVEVPPVEEVAVVERVSRRAARRATKAQRRRGIEPVEIPVAVEPDAHVF
jgi:hypothetical protein